MPCSRGCSLSRGRTIVEKRCLVSHVLRVGGGFGSERGGWGATHGIEVVDCVGLEGHGLVEPGLDGGRALSVRDGAGVGAAARHGCVLEVVGEVAAGDLDCPDAWGALEVAAGEEVGGCWGRRGCGRL